MSLTFLVPLFLLGVAGIAVPIVVHLTRRQRRNVVRFPSLMFLEKIPYQEQRRRRIQHWFLLSMRALALALLAIAFARPFMQDDRVGPGRRVGPPRGRGAARPELQHGGGRPARPRPHRGSGHLRRPGAPRPRVARGVLAGRARARPLDVRPLASSLRAGHGEAELGRHAVRPRPQGGADHPGGVEPPGWRGLHAERLPAQRLDGRRGRASAAGDRVHAGDPRPRQPRGESAGHRRVAARVRSSRAASASRRPRAWSDGAARRSGRCPSRFSSTARTSRPERSP